MREIVLDLPVPPSVNRSRKIDWSGHKLVRDWKRTADYLILKMPREKRPYFNTIEGEYSVAIILDEKTKSDPDNLIKNLLDYAVLLEAVRGDSPKFVKRITVEWGEAPEGVRVIFKQWEPT